MFFSASKDGTIRYWDADRFEHILTLRGHHAEVWCVVPSRSGRLVASISRDRSLRLWTRTEEQVFLEEEREAELDQLFEAGLDVDDAAHDQATGTGGVGETAMAGRRTIDSVKGAERVLEALKVLAEESERRDEHTAAKTAWHAQQLQLPAPSDGRAAAEPPVLVPNMLLLGLDERSYLIRALASVRATELEQALLLLPFESAKSLLVRLLPMLPNASPAELVARCVLFLVKVHHKQILVNGGMLATVDDLDRTLAARLSLEQSLVGYNLAAMRCLARSVEHSSTLGAARREPVSAADSRRRPKKKRARPGQA